MLARSNLGSTQSALQVSQVATTAAAATVPVALVAAHLVPALAAGPIGAGIAAVGMVVAALVANSGCGPTCVLATHLVDNLEPQLRANRDAYLAGPRTQANQAAALANFDAAFAWLRSAQACGAAELGNAGRRCIEDRDRGGKWDWYAYYRDPIANDPTVQQAAPLFATGTADNSLLWLAGGLVLMGIFL